jgi:predicted nucleic acid-binding protein
MCFGAATATDVSDDIAALAHDDLRSLRLELFPQSLCATRAWELRLTVTAYDEWSVALAETLGGATMAALDRSSTRAPGPGSELAFPVAWSDASVAWSGQ